MKILQYNLLKIENTKRVCFLTSSGFKTPQYIWKGKDNFNTELCEITKSGLIQKIEFNNRFFLKNPELLKN